MTREEELLEHIKKINLGREPVLAKMVQSFHDIIKTKLEAKGWEETMSWCREADSRLTNVNPLAAKLKHLYSQTYSKMWKLKGGNNDGTRTEEG